MKRVLVLLGLAAWVAFLIEADRRCDRAARMAAGESEAERRRGR